ncbi:hypothetical protein BKA70DRAFT_1569159 [Coprinopsis sp. MPI-PUGE-AT-0042]|nr:hypothetical protein BKA70DRAFT_1569159 [Coprinopsis sp. MPI-PUGE-AT-0042]
MPVAAAAAGVVQWASTSSSDSNHLSTGIKLHYSLFTESGTCPREVLSIQALARRALDGVQNAYCVGYSPEGTGVGAAITVDPQSAWTTLVHTLRQSSAPAFSLIAQPHLLLVLKRSLQQPSERELLQIAAKQVLYKQKAQQENGGVVANLLGAGVAEGRR